MATPIPKFPFEASVDELQRDLDPYVSAVFSCLVSEFLVLPKGAGFIDYPTFEQGYEALKRATRDFEEVSLETVLPVARTAPLSIIVMRTMLGFTPPEWAYLATQRRGANIPQGFARSLDRRIRMAPFDPLPASEETTERLKALITLACEMLKSGVPGVLEDKIHRLDKADTKMGISGIRALSHMGVPYAMLLYERFLGRPFAGHRDSVSELVGDTLELAVEDILTKAGISYRKTKRAERIAGFDQAPDFVVPSEFNPQVVIEAKITEDDGTASDKVTRIQHLSELSSRGPHDPPRYEVVAIIGGRGFGIRREDMKKMLLATGGKVFTLRTLDRLIDCTRLRSFRTTGQD